MGRSGNPAKRAQTARKPEPKRRRCYYCGAKTGSMGESTRLRRFPHAMRRQAWPPMCDMAARTRAILCRLQLEALRG